jgi:hypothetical protein
MHRDIHLCTDTHQAFWHQKTSARMENLQATELLVNKKVCFWALFYTEYFTNQRKQRTIYCWAKQTKQRR